MLKLFEKASIGKMKLKNRIVMAPMGTFGDTDGGYSTRLIDYFVARAEGGAGLLITGANVVSTKYEDRPCNELSSFHHVDRLGYMIQNIHLHGAKLCVQLSPGLGRMVFTDPFTPPYSAGEVESFWFPGLMTKPFPVEGIQHLVKQMGWSAYLAKAAGADAVEIHAYGGYLLDQFHSKQWNNRTDEYGGDLRGRMRFTLEIIAEIRKMVGNDFPVLIKFTPYHGVPGGRELPEGLEMAKILEEAGVNALHVDVGCYEAWYKAISTVYQAEGHQIPIFEAVKKTVSVPVIGQGKLFDPKLAESVLQENKTDFVALGHQMLSDPAWPNKVKSGETYDIVPCIGCNECLKNGFSGNYWSCSVNPLLLREADYPLPPKGEKRSVLVIGGGPAGMKAAITARERGFDVELWERNAHLGGTLLQAGEPDFKKDVLRLVDYLINKTFRSGVHVRLMKEATADEIIAGHYDKVVLAAGSRSLIPRIPGIDGAQVKTSSEILLGASFGKKVVVIGGGLVGCETAAYLSERGAQVSLIEILGDILLTSDHCKNNDQALRTLVCDCAIDIHTGAKVTSIGENTIAYEKDGVALTMDFDTVVIAAGYLSNNELEDQLDGKVKDMTVIGDALAPRKIMTAIHEAYHTIRMMK